MWARQFSARPSRTSTTVSSDVRWVLLHFRCSGAARGGSCSGEHVSAEQVEAGAAVHAALQQLEPVYLPFYGPIAPRQRHSGTHGVVVLPKPRDETPKQAVARLLYPTVEGALST